MIERDDKFRQSIGLSTPSLDELRAKKAVKLIRGANRKSLLIRLGVIDRPRPAYRRDYDRNRGSGSYERRRRSVYVSVCVCLSLC